MIQILHSCSSSRNVVVVFLACVLFKVFGQMFPWGSRHHLKAPGETIGKESVVNLFVLGFLGFYNIGFGVTLKCEIFINMKM